MRALKALVRSTDVAKCLIFALHDNLVIITWIRLTLFQLAVFRCPNSNCNNENISYQEHIDPLACLFHKTSCATTTLNNYANQKGANETRSDVLNCVPFHNRDFSLRKEFAHSGSKFFPLRVVSYCMVEYYFHIMWFICIYKFHYAHA